MYTIEEGNQYFKENYKELNTAIYDSTNFAWGSFALNYYSYYLIYEETGSNSPEQNFYNYVSLSTSIWTSAYVGASVGGPHGALIGGLAGLLMGTVGEIVSDSYKPRIVELGDGVMGLKHDSKIIYKETTLSNGKLFEFENGSTHIQITQEGETITHTTIKVGDDILEIDQIGNLTGSNVNDPAKTVDDIKDSIINQAIQDLDGIVPAEQITGLLSPNTHIDSNGFTVLETPLFTEVRSGSSFVRVLPNYDATVSLETSQGHTLYEKVQGKYFSIRKYYDNSNEVTGIQTFGDAGTVIFYKNLTTGDFLQYDLETIQDYGTVEQDTVLDLFNDMLQDINSEVVRLLQGPSGYEVLSADSASGSLSNFLTEGSTPIILDAQGGEVQNFLGTDQSDIVFLNNSSGDHNIFLSHGNNRVDGGNATGDLMVSTGDGNDDITTGSGNDYIYAGGGQNLVFSGDGKDTIFTGNDFDEIISGSGSDIIIASSGSDIIDGGAHDTTRTDRIARREDVKNDVEPGTDGFGGDTLDYGLLGEGLSVAVDLSVGTADIINGNSIIATQTVSNIENIKDSSGDDVVIGSDDDNIIIHSGGSDHYKGGDGDDLFIISVPQSGEVIRVFGDDGSDIVRISGNIGISGYARSRSSEQEFHDGSENEDSDYTYLWRQDEIDGALVDVLVLTHKATGGIIELSGTEYLQFEDGAFSDERLSNDVIVQEGAEGVLHNDLPPGVPSDGEYPPQVDHNLTPDENGEGNQSSITFTDPVTGEQRTVTYSGDTVVSIIPGLPKLWVEGGKLYWYPDFSEIPGFKSPDDAPTGELPEDPPEDEGEEPEENPEEAEDVEDVEEAVDQSEATGSPLVLDLDGDGIELTALEGSSVYWDLDQDGFAESTGWVAADDGLLAIDLDGNGLINTHEELFGSISEDGFTALSVYDTNSDGVIDSNDAQFDDLMVWRDLNQNGVSGANELQSLSDLDIVSINLNAYQPYQLYLEGHHISHISTYTTDDEINGPQTHDIVDAWFQYDNLISLYNEHFDLDPFTFALPNMRGYGDMPTLQIAMSIDNDQDNPESLMSLMQAFTDREFTDYFVDDGSVMQDIRTIMLRWAGADQVEDGSRGQWADAQELVYLETFLGDPYLQYGGNPNPGSLAAASANRAFEIAMLPVAGRIISQAIAADLFEGDLVYDAKTDTFSGFTGFKQDALDMLVAKAIDGTIVQDKVAFWMDVVRVIKHSVGIDNLSSSDYDQLEAALVESDEFLTVQHVIDKMQHDIDVHETWILKGESVAGTSEDDVYVGTVRDDHFSGGYGNDVIDGGIGDDLIYGGAGNDIINGGHGNDDLRGDHGDDTYLFFRGHGDDLIYEMSGNDRILFDDGITVDDVVLTRIDAYNLKISLDPSVGAGSVTIMGQFSGGIVETLEFADGTTLDLGSLDYTYIGSDESETIYGVRQGVGGSGVDTLYGNGGDDAIYASGPSGASAAQNELYGGDGNDTLYGENYGDLLDGGADNDTINAGSGADIIIGGTGDDNLKGGWSDDLYIFNYGDGNDVIYDSRGTNDILRFGEGINFESLHIYRVNNNDIMIEIDGGNGGSIYIEYQTYGYSIETLEFHDGSTVAMSSLELTLTGTDGNDTLQGVRLGASQVDTIYGEGGDDIIYGYQVIADYNNNFLYGGTGNDKIYASHGEDYIEGNEGNDLIFGYNGSDDIHGGDGGDIIYGGNQNDNLNGGAGDDVLYGDNNDDILNGGLGADTLTGGGGYDTFVFGADSSFDAVDMIMDFSTYYDAIDISDLLSEYDPLNDTLSDFVQITDDGSDSLLSIDVDGGGDNFVAIALIDNRTGLTDVDDLATNGQLVTV